MFLPYYVLCRWRSSSRGRPRQLPQRRCLLQSELPWSAAVNVFLLAGHSIGSCIGDVKTWVCGNVVDLSWLEWWSEVDAAKTIECAREGVA